MLYSETYGYNEGYFSEIEELIEYCEAEGVKIPDYCWSTTQIYMSMDADSIIESACEELHEGAMDFITNDDRKKLQDFLDEWCNKQHGTSTYMVNYRYSIDI